MPPLARRIHELLGEKGVDVPFGILKLYALSVHWDATAAPVTVLLAHDPWSGCCAVDVKRHFSATPEEITSLLKLLVNSFPETYANQLQGLVVTFLEGDTRPPGIMLADHAPEGQLRHLDVIDDGDISYDEGAYRPEEVEDYSLVADVSQLRGSLRSLTQSLNCYSRGDDKASDARARAILRRERFPDLLHDATSARRVREALGPLKPAHRLSTVLTSAPDAGEADYSLQRIAKRFSRGASPGTSRHMWEKHRRDVYARAVGHALTQVRLSHGYSQAEMGVASGLSQQEINRMENDPLQVSAEKRNKYLLDWGCDPADFDWWDKGSSVVDEDLACKINDIFYRYEELVEAEAQGSNFAWESVSWRPVEMASSYGREQTTG